MLFRRLRQLRCNRSSTKWASTVSASVIDSLPAYQSTESLWPRIREVLATDSRRLVCLDDDPTGCQTLHDVNLLLDYSVDSIVSQLKRDEKLFYILTNSRALDEAQAVEVNKQVIHNVTEAARICRYPHLIQFISRSDSTLRGHYPSEVEAIIETTPVAVDATIIVPAFFDGGRYTINDIHYLREKDVLVPVGETVFAKDNHFGYASSDLKEWVAEKYSKYINSHLMRGDRKIPPVFSISIDDIRKKGAMGVENILESVPIGSVVVVNAVNQHDLNIFTLGLLQAELSGHNFVYRTAASFVNSRAGIEPISLLSALPSEPELVVNRNGGLIVVGSYIPKSSSQLQHLIDNNPNMSLVEIKADVIFEKVGKDNFSSPNTDLLSKVEEYIEDTTRSVDLALKAGQDVVVFTSRNYSSTTTLPQAALISSVITSIVNRLSTRPWFLIAKGGITSHTVAADGLKAKSARVIGQLDYGVPVWKLGSEAKFPGMSYIVFPGNVGSESSISDVVRKLTAHRPTPSAHSVSTNSITTKPPILIASSERKPILMESVRLAQSRNAAIPAFNIYNVEGVLAVTSAAKALGSPVILQFNPATLRATKNQLLLLTLAVRETANNDPENPPVYVHLDHATPQHYSEIELAVSLGVDSVMVDGSMLPLNENIQFTKSMVDFIESVSKCV